MGRDGWDLLQLLRQAHAPSWLVNLPAVEVLRQVWVQQYGRADETTFWRSNDNIPPSSLLISSPYDPDAHMSIKRSTVWTGYKVHLTETCDEETPHLLIHVETTTATTQDMEMTDVIHQGLSTAAESWLMRLFDTAGKLLGPIEPLFVVFSERK